MLIAKYAKSANTLLHLPPGIKNILRWVLSGILFLSAYSTHLKVPPFLLLLLLLLFLLLLMFLPIRAGVENTCACTYDVGTD
jgi:hypothetical protein